MNPMYLHLKNSLLSQQNKTKDKILHITDFSQWCTTRSAEQGSVWKQKYKYSNKSSRWFTFTVIEQLDSGDSDSVEDVMMKYTSNDGGQKGD